MEGGLSEPLEGGVKIPRKCGWGSHKVTRQLLELNCIPQKRSLGSPNPQFLRR